MRTNNFSARNIFAHHNNCYWTVVFSSKSLILIVCVLFVLLVPVDFFYPINPEARMVPHLLRAAILVILLLCAMGALFRSISFPLAKLLFVYSLLLILQSLFVSENLKAVWFELSKFLIWPIGTIAFYLWTRAHRFNSRLMVVTVSLILVPAIIKSVTISLNPTAYTLVETNAYAYFLLFSIPLILIVGWPSKTSLALALLAGFAIVLSLKRGAVVALTLSMLAYGITYSKCNSKPLIYRKLVPFILIFAIVVISVSVWRWDQLLLRWADASDLDSIGSGRGTFYRLILQHWLSGDFVNKIFGLGLFSVAPSIGNRGYFEEYAHSDWLQILHDQGVIGISLFAAIHLSILKMIHQSFQMKHLVTPSLVMGETIFLLANIYSGCTADTESMLCFSMLLGYSSAKIGEHHQQMQPAFCEITRNRASLKS